LKRFHFGDDEDEEEEEFKPDFFSMSQFPIETGNVFLESAIKICEKSLFWRFYTTNYKLKKIKIVYDFLTLLDEGGNDAKI
jgi:hypothetical protein